MKKGNTGLPGPGPRPSCACAHEGNYDSRLFNENGSIRAHGRAPTLQVYKKPFIFFDKDGHALELLKGRDGSISLFCPLCRLRLSGFPKAALRVQLITRVRLVEMPVVSP